MASSYPPPFEGTGEVKEGFLCPLCLKDLQSFYQLQDHYEEEHSGDDRHVRGQLKSRLSSLFIFYLVLFLIIHFRVQYSSTMTDKKKRLDITRFTCFTALKTTATI